MLEASFYDVYSSWSREAIEVDGASGTSDVGLYDGREVFVSRVHVEECNEAWLSIGALRVMSRTFVC